MANLLEKWEENNERIETQRLAEKLEEIRLKNLMSPRTKRYKKYPPYSKIRYSQKIDRALMMPPWAQAPQPKREGECESDYQG